MKITRVFTMPDRFTFKMKPVEEILMRLVGDGSGWIDPFSGESRLAQHRNDFNPDRPCETHLDALDFVKGFTPGKYSGVLFDPPYSPEQMKRSYDEIGVPKVPYDVTIYQYGDVKDWLAHILPCDALAICFGWNSCGLGKGRGFKLLEIHMLNHGGRHNDTIVTVEKKIQGSLFNEVDFGCSGTPSLSAD